MLKKGEAELGIAAEIDEEWDRLDTWPLFTEDFQLVISRGHRLAERDGIVIEDLRTEQLFSRSYCEGAERLSAALRESGIDVERCHEIAWERDLIELVEADIGIAVIPETSPIPKTLKRTLVEGLDARARSSSTGLRGATHRVARPSCACCEARTGSNFSTDQLARRAASKTICRPAVC